MKTTPIRKKDDAQRLIDYFFANNQTRNYVLVTAALYTCLRISDILALTWSDFYDFESRRFKEEFSLKERKTGKYRTIAVNNKLINALKLYIHAAAPGKPLIINEKTGNAISRVQAYRIIREASNKLALPGKVTPHSLRKTFGYHAYKDGASSVTIMEVYNHSSWEITRRYLCLTQDDINKVYLQMDYSGRAA